MLVGIIGPLDSGQKIKKYLNEIDENLEIKLYIREIVSEMIEVIEECEDECDAIIFTGCGVEAAIKSKYKVKKTNSYVSRGGVSVFKAFWKANKSNISLGKFSIDVVEKSIIENTVREIEIEYKEMYSLPFSTDVDEMEYARWHMELYDNKKIDVIFTGFGAVYKELKKRGYPVFRLEAIK
ncbi:MAG: transcriptional regulator, partial [Peptostreptococcaceae bacterium]